MGFQFLRVIFLIILVVLQLIALCLAISALSVPLWVDTTKDNQVYFENNGKTVKDLKHAGLWQLCFEPLLADPNDPNERIGLDELGNAEDFGESWQNAFQSIDDCTRDGLQEFYESESIWGGNMWSHVIAVRAMAIIFIIAGFVKLFLVIAAKCSSRGKSDNEGGWCFFYIAIGMAFFEMACGVIGIAVWASIVDGAADESKNPNRLEDNNYRLFDDFRDYAGASFWLYMVATLVAFIANIMICI
eukprot:TRINITY_DN709_c0_g2_i10.p2 TRINITY_DN709_c0_g2~~TRINITY_DN709_c0_g2_i10.p2  ORF type:complete len:245 (-),score=37.93 TRINITY_DN709_c0_g2_i10:1338-2072(-)